MAEPIAMWETIIDEGVALLDWRLVTRGGVALLLARVAAAVPHPNVLTAARAAMEIDKLIAFDLADPRTHEAATMRRTLLQAMLAKTPSYDLEQATAALLDRYRMALASAVRRAAGQDPGRRLAQIASRHQ